MSSIHTNWRRYGKAAQGPALPPSTKRLLHPAGRDGGRRAGHGQAVGGVDDGDGVASPGGGGLVKLESGLLALVGRRDEGWRGGVEREGRGDLLRVLRRRGVRRVARQR